MDAGHGGVAPYGYGTVKRADGWYLAVDAAEARVIRDEILPRVLSHESTNSIAAALNRAGVPARRGGQWSGVAIRTLMKRRALLGQHEHKGKVVTDEDGLAVLRSDPILTVQEFERAQQVLQSRSVRLSKRNVNPFAGILFCYVCDAPLYPQGMQGRDYTYYRCRNRYPAEPHDGSPPCSASAVRSDLVSRLVEELLLDEIGDIQRRERVYVQGSDHTEALAGVVQ
ncbi:MAG TPA: recombinase family protein, partial [Mycobacterium sp.]